MEIKAAQKLDTRRVATVAGHRTCCLACLLEGHVKNATTPILLVGCTTRDALRLVSGHDGGIMSRE
jgi:hypothetical protein